MTWLQWQQVHCPITSRAIVMILSFRSDLYGQTLKTQIKVYTVCHPDCLLGRRLMHQSFVNTALNPRVGRIIVGQRCWAMARTQCNNNISSHSPDRSISPWEFQRLRKTCKITRIFNGCEVLIENSVTRVTVRQASWCPTVTRLTEFSISTE